MTTPTHLTFAAAVLLVSGCGEETPPYSVEDFLSDRILLEATMVRCGQDQSAGRHDPNCVTAREAVDRIAAAEARERREALEAESERKREALRRARDAADERRRLAEEAERQRRHAEQFGAFEPLPDDAINLTDDGAEDGVPTGDESTNAGAGPAEEAGAAPETGDVTDEPADSDDDTAEQESPEIAPEEVTSTP